MMKELESESIRMKRYLNTSIEENPQRLYARRYLLLKI